MRTPIMWPSRGDLFGILIVAALLAAFVFGYVVFPARMGHQGSPNNFGPDWDCQYVPKSEPVCVKKIPRRATD